MLCLPEIPIHLIQPEQRIGLDGEALALLFQPRIGLNAELFMESMNILGADGKSPCCWMPTKTF